MRICPQCNSQVPQEAVACRICSLPLVGDMFDDGEVENSFLEEKICPSCNSNNDSKWLFCFTCGSPLIDEPTKPFSEESFPSIKSDFSFNPNLENKSGETSNSSPKKLTDSVKTPANSIQDLTFCSVCGEANLKDADFCSFCKNMLARTLAMGSQPGYPKLRLLDDGKESETYDITESEFIIGRSEGHITFPEDNYMSSSHARIVKREQKYFLVDDHSKNGIYKRLKEEIILKNGTIVLIGRQIFRFEQ